MGDRDGLLPGDQADLDLIRVLAGFGDLHLGGVGFARLRRFGLRFTLGGAVLLILVGTIGQTCVLPATGGQQKRATQAEGRE